MQLFVDSSSMEIIKIEAKYLKTKGSSYIEKDIWFILYGYFKAINKHAVSVILTILSSGIRFFLHMFFYMLNQSE